MQLQRHEQHMVTVFYLLSSQMKSTRIKYSRLKRPTTLTSSRLSLTPGFIFVLSTIVVFQEAYEEI